MESHWQRPRESGPDGNSLRSVLSSSSLPIMDEDNNYLQTLPQQHLENISVSDILNRDCEHNGFLYKRAQEKVTDQITEFISPAILSKWQLRYVILYHEYILYYKNEKCNKPKGVFSLRGYNRVVRAEDMTSANQQWAFKVIGLRSEDRTWYFGAASEREMRLWMAFFKVTMEKAIHGKARDKSLRILKDLQYKETKFIQSGGDQFCPPSATTFEPGIYEDIEEPLEELDYLPPKMGASFNRQLPIPPRVESLEASRGPAMPMRGMLPLPPSRPEPERRESTLSTESGDYIRPQEADIDQIRQFRSTYGSQSQTGFNSPVHSPIQKGLPPPPLPSNDRQRQAPEGNSFRKKPFVEMPPNVFDVKDVKAALKPVVPLKPKLNPKPTPTPPRKPDTALKPKPALRSPVSPKELLSRQSAVQPITRDLLPPSAVFNSKDKRAAEGLLHGFGVDGMYLTRLSAGPGKVLMVYHKNMNQCKHYKVFGNEVNTFSLTTEPILKNMQELLQYYSDNPLPNTTVSLTEPYPG